MGTRELKGLLRVLKDAGVTSYTCGDLSVTFGAQKPQAQTELEFRPQEQDEAADSESLDLPAGVWDPREMIARMNRSRGERS